MKHTYCPHCGEAVQAAELVHTKTTYNRKQVASAGPARNGRARLWQSMRVLPSFTALDLAATAEATLPAVWRYLSTLQTFGFVRCTHKSSGETGDHSRYKLVKNPGPHYPRLRNDGSVFEPNSGQVLQPEVSHAA